MRMSVALSINGLPAPGLLADLAGQVETLERELDRAGPLAVVGGVDPVADVVVQLGLPEHRQPGEEVAGGDLLTGGDQHPALERVDQQREVEAAEDVPDRLRGRRPQEMGEDLVLAALLAGLELDLAAEHVARRLEADPAGHPQLTA